MLTSHRRQRVGRGWRPVTTRDDGSSRAFRTWSFDDARTGVRGLPTSTASAAFGVAAGREPTQAVSSGPRNGPSISVGGRTPPERVQRARTGHRPRRRVEGRHLPIRLRGTPNDRTGNGPLKTLRPKCDVRAMGIRELVNVFYDRLWNDIDLGAADEILHPEVTFRGSVGVGARGRREVCDYVRMVTAALSGYRCEIQSLIVEGDHAAAKVRFSGTHRGEFLGHEPPGRHVEWIGAAFFTADGHQLCDIWVLGDLVSLHAQLRSSA